MKSGIGDVEIRPGIFVHAAVATFLSKRLQWIEGGEEGPFQVTVPSGLEFDDLCTLALLLANDELNLAKERIWDYQCHIVRTWIQSSEWGDMLATMDPGTAMVTSDWAMKYEV